MNLKTTAKAKGSMPNKKTKFPSRSTAAKTKMLTVCKNCGKPNDNGYQYCTACHQANKDKYKRVKGRAIIVQPTPPTPVIDRDDVLKVCAEEL